MRFTESGRETLDGPPRRPHCRRRFLAVLVTLAAAFAAAEAQALRCDGRLVSEGDRRFEVRQACGEPDFVEPVAPPGHVVAIEGNEIWHYNFGPQRFIRVLRFREGRLESIERAGRGFSATAATGRCRPADLRRGMSSHELRARCGEPVERQWRLVRTDESAAGERFVQEWIYDFDGGRDPRAVDIASGRVVSIRRL